jgi:D-arabinose 1-dehydrogenase-like Zn-dependent alcohol dehydrogenase
MIRFAKPLALFLCAALGLAAASPAWAQQSSAADAKKKAAKAAPAVAAAATAKPADKKADAGPGKPLLVASFGDWGVYQTQAAKGRVCYTLAQPKDRAPADLKRDAAYAFISDRPSEGVRNEISFIMGFDVANPAELAAAKSKAAGKDAMAMVGDQSFELLAKTANLWVKNAAKEGQLIDEMRKGSKLQVMASSKKGHMTTDTYSLSGFSQALDRVQKDCPSK